MEPLTLTIPIASMPSYTSAPPNTDMRPTRHSRAAAAGLNLTFEQIHYQSAYSYASTSSNCSSPTSPTAPSPYPITPVNDLANPLVADGSSSDGENSWNLIPYNVPWGPEYYHYQAGTLPGPEGACIFLRSPTPAKNKRTAKACNRCRERKAKCSGVHPACSRCVLRGYICEYAPEDRRVRGPSLSRQRRRDKGAAAEDFSGSDAQNTPSTSYSSELSVSPSRASFKHEDLDERGVCAELMYPPHAGEASSWGPYYAESAQNPEDYAPPPVSDGCYMIDPADYLPAVDCAHASEGFASASLEALPGTSDSPPLVAPRPITYSQPMPFLLSPEDDFSDADTAFVPRLSQQPAMSPEHLTMFDTGLEAVHPSHESEFLHPLYEMAGMLSHSSFTEIDPLDSMHANHDPMAPLCDTIAYASSISDEPADGFMTFSPACDIFSGTYY
ncbi:hypothetical protein CERSUDRAFT_97176 [Gelatoporia subvermispora B]|uniref:Zn(2)-C6 fungal-type domain-containing protein n=1 Tax=Ceriporiopsis subvermispora (strain B) TaxID=914234 RepID=M2R7C3_CERS8|nr:hypothetical protein CERSUDRAFT_97176 [Gelatoporia subvermispora B]